MTESVERVLLGKILAPFGVQGWVKVHSESRPIADIGRYRTWQLKLKDGWTGVRVKSFKTQGKGLIAKLEGVNDRQQAEAMAGVEIAVDSAQLPALAEGEYYWRDLIGLRVFTLQGVDLGVVDHLLETGANDVLVVHGERERLLPLVVGSVVVQVDLVERRMTVDWDADF
ncbi:MAG: ribosome maturation factor RimM [Pseudomonadota bacterium]